MATPTRQQIYARATELYFQHEHRSGNHNINTPEYSELLESGFVSQAQSELMSNPETLYGLPRIKTQPETKSGSFEVDLTEALKTGIFTSGTSGSGKSDIGMYVAKNFMQYGVIVVVFDSSQDWLNRSSIAKYVAVKPHARIDIPRESVIFDISHIAILEQQSLVEDFCKRLMLLQASRTHRKQYFLIFEEAHGVFPEGCLKAKRFQNTVKMMTQGRNFAVRFMAITQFSSLIDKTAMRYMKQRYFGFTDERNDVAYLRSFLGKDVEQLKTLEAGEFVYYFAGKTKKIQIKPYESESLPALLHVPEIQPITPQPITTTKPHRSSESNLYSVFVALIFLAAIWIALGA